MDYLSKYLFNSLVNSSFISSRRSLVVASNRIVILGPVLEALTRANPSENFDFDPSIVRVL